MKFYASVVLVVGVGMHVVGWVYVTDPSRQPFPSLGVIAAGSSLMTCGFIAVLWGSYLLIDRWKPNQ